MNNVSDIKSQVKIKNGLKEYSVMFVFLVFAIWLTPIFLLLIPVIVGYKIKKSYDKKQVVESVKQEWFPRGKNVFFLYSNSEKWKKYFETELIPKIQERAVVWNWSTRISNGWKDDLLEAKILQLFRPLGYFYPSAYVFHASGEVEVFSFYEVYLRQLNMGSMEYKEMEKKFIMAMNNV